MAKRTVHIANIRDLYINPLVHDTPQMNKYARKPLVAQGFRALALTIHYTDNIPVFQELLMLTSLLILFKIIHHIRMPQLSHKGLQQLFID